jgi:hypothetical protein
MNTCQLLLELEQHQLAAELLEGLIEEVVKLAPLMHHSLCLAGRRGAGGPLHGRGGVFSL